jgi:hypothetical protein
VSQRFLWKFEKGVVFARDYEQGRPDWELPKPETVKDYSKEILEVLSTSHVIFRLPSNTLWFMGMMNVVDALPDRESKIAFFVERENKFFKMCVEFAVDE